jgi:hypothetical protein
MSLHFPDKAKEVIKQPIPGALIKTRKGGGGVELSYISGSTVIDYLNRAFDYLWSSEIVQQWKEESTPKFNPKYDKEPVPQNPVVHAKVRLTVYIPTENGSYIALTKDGVGSKEVLGGQSDQADNYKAASTDALKKAASLFGIGLELYRSEDEQEFFDSLDYEDPWTDDVKKQFAKELAFVKDFMENYELEDLDEYVNSFSDGALTSTSDIVPENIKAFVEYLEAIISSAENQG